MHMKHLQHMQHMQHPLIYFCNIKMEQLQHTSETSETLSIHVQHRGGEGRGGSIPAAGVGAGSEWRRASTTATTSGLGSAGRAH